MKLFTKRVYDNPSKSDGRRILIDRLWPRGVSKERARIDFWAKDAAPSNELRRWYRHDPEKWDDFRRRYFAELANNPDAVAELRENLGKSSTTLVFGSKETEWNNARALKEYLETHS